MQYKLLGNTGVMVSALCFGTMSFGGDADRDTSRAMYQRCREAGINFFDCANIYVGGRSEEILGECMAGSRNEIVLTSKAYFPTGADINARGATRKHLMYSVEQSLRRLKTDYLDLFFIHRFDDKTPLEETLRVLDDLVRQGKILYPAASNFAAWQVEKGLGISARQGWARFECLQPMYNLIKRQAEVEVLPMAQAEHLGVIPYSPMAGGLLSGKYGSDQQPEKGRLVENKMYQTRYSADWVQSAVERFSAFARKLGYEPATLAVAWVASHPGITAPIIGARNLDQLAASLAAAEVTLTPELRAEVSAFTPEPPLATDRSEERTPFTFGQR
jgi:aryl-alcohol dehydrogenase-like predicted oxidoreductase